MKKKETSSFKDSGGKVFYENKKVYRKINYSYKDHYEELMTSGLYEELREKNLLVAHEETEKELGYKVIKPEKLDFISYPYEWGFLQLKQAALQTLQIQKICLKYGMSLKDASAYNIQFKNGDPIFIDTTSFRKYEKGYWEAYEQFCSHFLVPLCLMYYVDRDLGELMKSFPEGIPLDLALQILPLRTKFKPRIFLHTHLLNIFQNKHLEGKNLQFEIFSKKKLLKFVEHLEKTIEKIGSSKNENECSNNTKFEKYNVISKYISKIGNQKAAVISAERENLEIYQELKNVELILFSSKRKNIDDIFEKIKEDEVISDIYFMDLRSPSPGLGWGNDERKSFMNRNFPDLGITLTGIERLVLNRQIPMEMVSKQFSEMFDQLVVEFKPKENADGEQLQKLVEPKYTKDCFEENFKDYYEITDKVKIDDTGNILYLMEKERKN